MRSYLNLLRSGVLWSLFFFFALVLALLYPLLSFFNNKETIYQMLMRFGYRTILFFAWISVKVKGLENIPNKKGYIIAANHTSFLDNMVMPSALPVPFRFLAAAAGFSLPLIGTVERGAGYLKASPEMKFEEIAALYRALKKGESVLIYTDVRTGEFAPAMFALARQAEVPILPVRIEGTSKMLPLGKFFLQDGEVSVSIGKSYYN
jgi:1-acyl-sn-glycerol-3-phosphate acyltransferase